MFVLHLLHLLHFCWTVASLDHQEREAASQLPASKLEGLIRENHPKLTTRAQAQTDLLRQQINEAWRFWRPAGWAVLWMKMVALGAERPKPTECYL